MDRKTVWNKTGREGVTKHIINAIQNFTNTTITLDLKQILRDKIKTNKGVKQGC